MKQSETLLTEWEKKRRFKFYLNGYNLENLKSTYSKLILTWGLYNEEQINQKNELKKKEKEDEKRREREQYNNYQKEMRRQDEDKYLKEQRQKEELMKLSTKIGEVESEVNNIIDEDQKVKLKALLTELKLLISQYIEIIRLANVIASYNLAAEKELRDDRCATRRAVCRHAEPLCIMGTGDVCC